MASEQQKKEHAIRKAWNEETIRRLGLTLVKQQGQTLSLSVFQGDFTVYHDWTNHSGETLGVSHTARGIFKDVHPTPFEDYTACRSAICRI